MNQIKPKYFVPISLGNHFYSKHRIQEVYAKYLCKSNESLIVVCDSLREYSKLANPKISVVNADSHTRLEAENLSIMLKKAGVFEDKNVKMSLLSDLLYENGFVTLLKTFPQLLSLMPTVAVYLHELTEYWAKHHYLEFDEKIYGYQRRYIIEETVLSIYITEIKGYNIELYTDDSGLLVTKIYRDYGKQLAKFLGKGTLDRRFEVIKLEGEVVCSD